MKKFTEITDLKECFEITGLPDAKTIAEIPAEFHEQMLANYRNMVKAKCANQLSRPGETLDYKNHNQRKWFPWFNMLSSGSVDFCDTNYNYSFADAGDASRLAFLEENDARHAGINLKDDYAISLTK